MSRRCDLTGKGPATGNRVSHSHRKTRRRFLPNLQPASLRSDLLGRIVRLRVSTSAPRTVTRAGGLDAYLLRAAPTSLSETGLKLQTQVKKAVAKPRPKTATES